MASPESTYPDKIRRVNFSIVVRDAIRRARLLIDHYPKKFHSIHDAKSYIQGICEDNGFDYGLLPNVLETISRSVKDRVHFVVAIEAYVARQFHLDVPCYSRKELHDAIEVDIKRLRALVPSWPRSYKHLNEARDYVHRLSKKNNFRYTGCLGFPIWKFTLYANFEAARHAWEDGELVLALDNSRQGQEARVKQSESPFKPAVLKAQSPSPTRSSFTTLTNTSGTSLQDERSERSVSPSMPGDLWRKGNDSSLVPRALTERYSTCRPPASSMSSNSSGVLKDRSPNPKSRPSSAALVGTPQLALPRPRINRRDRWQMPQEAQEAQEQHEPQEPQEHQEHREPQESQLPAINYDLITFDDSPEPDPEPVEDAGFNELAADIRKGVIQWEP